MHYLMREQTNSNTNSMSKYRVDSGRKKQLVTNLCTLISPREHTTDDYCGWRVYAVLLPIGYLVIREAERDLVRPSLDNEYHLTSTLLAHKEVTVMNYF